MLLDDLIDCLAKKGVQRVVCERALLPALSGCSLETTDIEDARSAAFFAGGLVQKEKRPVLLALCGDSLPSAYTALTEAWFQQSPLLVCAVYNDVLNVDTEYLKRCSGFRIKLQKPEQLHLIDTEGLRAPGVILLEQTLPPAGQPAPDPAPLARALAPEGRLFVYEPLCGPGCENASVISRAHRYGILSKYAGFCAAAEVRSALVTTADSIALELNIFNNRYLSPRFKAVFCGDTREYDGWLESNDIKVRHAAALTDGLAKEFMEEDKPSVLFIAGEEQHA